MEPIVQEDLIGKYLTGELSAGEKAQLMAWVDANAQNRAVFEEMIQLWSLTETPIEPEFTVNVPQAWAALDARLEQATSTANPLVKTAPLAPLHSKPGTGKIRRLPWAWSVAAAVAILVLGAWWLFLRDATPKSLAFSTGENERREITLPDQSKVFLNENSTLSYTYAGATRQVELRGEAFFDVQKDAKHPFVIQSGAVQTKVLGTSFNIRAYPDEPKVKVTVKTGRVEVRKTPKMPNADKAPLILNPGNTAVYSIQTTELAKSEDVAPVEADAWQQGTVFVPYGTTLAEVIPIVEKLYDVHIDADPAVLDITCSDIRFTRDMSVKEAFSLFSYTLQVKFLPEGNNIYIYK